MTKASHSVLLLISWVEESWVSELTIVVLGVELANNELSLLDEVINVHLVGEVSVKVVLEVLNHVHTGLNALVSSNSWERESLVEELPGVNSWCLHTELLSDLHSVLVVLLIEMSRELIHLPVHLVSGDPESWLTGTSLWGKSINDAIVSLEVNQVLDGGLGSGGVSD